jgi:hypothetical protein
MNLAALLEPATLLGTIPGVLLNVVFPAYIITILLVLLLAFTAYATLKKGIQQKRLEDATRAAAANAEKASVLPPPHPAASVQNYAPSRANCRVCVHCLQPRRRRRTALWHRGGARRRLALVSDRRAVSLVRRARRPRSRSRIGSCAARGSTGRSRARRCR